MPIDPQSANNFDVSPPYCRLKNLALVKIIVPFESGDFYMSGMKSKTCPFRQRLDILQRAKKYA